MAPIELLKAFITKGGTPQQLLQGTPIQNPMINNLINMAHNGDVKSVEEFARNVFKEQGRDFDKEFAEFKNTFR